MNIEELYQARLRGDVHPDIKDHLPMLRAYGERCRAVVEFGCRTGNSTTAFLSSGTHLYSFDIKGGSYECPPDAKDRWIFTEIDSLKLTQIPACDLLFIDSAHCEEVVRKELSFHPFVHRWIILHDTITWAGVSDFDRDLLGINAALMPFLAEQKYIWHVAAHYNNCNGLTILERCK